MKYILVIAALLASYLPISGQCADDANIYSFTYNGHSYEVVKENKTWTDASTCAISRNGYLAEINDEAEQDAVFTALTDNAGIVTDNTQNQFGTASVWLGGSDAGTEGSWIWDGNNDGMGAQFWSGGPNGSPVGGLYSNWGTSPAEPDNSGGQDHLTIIIKPSAVNFGLWNDLVSTNTIYYLIEYNEVVSTEEVVLKENITVYPNPFTNFISIENNSEIAVDRISIMNILGQNIKTIYPIELTNNEINVADLEDGMYLLILHFENGEVVSRKVLKE